MRKIKEVTYLSRLNWAIYEWQNYLCVHPQTRQNLVLGYNSRYGKFRSKGEAGPPAL